MSILKKYSLGICLLLGTLTCYSVNSIAGRYELIDGKKYEICRDLVENLNKHPEWPPLACEFKVDTKDKKFSMPQWVNLKPLDHMDLIENIIKEHNMPHQYIKNPGDYVAKRREKAWHDAENNVRAWAENGESRLYRAVFDVNHDGKQDVVYRYLSRSCDPHHDADFEVSGLPMIYVADKDGQLPDLSFGAINSPPRDVFLYQGRAYLTWWLGDSKQGTANIGVYETSSPIQAGQYSDINVCTLKYFSGENK